MHTVVNIYNIYSADLYIMVSEKSVQPAFGSKENVRLIKKMLKKNIKIRKCTKIKSCIYSKKWFPPQSDLEKGVNGLHINDVTPDTVATSSRFSSPPGPKTEALVPPIYHSSTYKLQSVDDYLKILEEVCILHITLISIFATDHFTFWKSTNL